MNLNIETVQDLNRGQACSTIISASGEIVSNYTGYAKAGHKLDKSLSTTEIAKLIRKDIKALGWTKKNGFKISVTSEYFAGGSAIRVEAKEIPLTKEQSLTEKYLTHKDSEDAGMARFVEQYDQKYTAQYKMIEEMLEHIIKSYNYSDCDSQIDYFNVNFYSDVVMPRFY